MRPTGGAGRLVTPTGSLPSPRWRRLARVMVATPVLLVAAATLAGGPFDRRGHGRLLLVANQVTLAVTTVAVVAAAGSLVGRFRRFNRARYDAARTIAAFSTRLRQQVDLTTLTAELVAVVDQTMQPTTASAGPAGRARRARRGDRGDALELAHGDATGAGTAWSPQDLR